MKINNRHPNQDLYDGLLQIKNAPTINSMFSLILFFYCFFVIKLRIKIYEINSSICIEDKSGEEFLSSIPILYSGRFWVNNKIKNKRPFLLEIYNEVFFYEEINKRMTGSYPKKIKKINKLFP